MEDCAAEGRGGTVFGARAKYRGELGATGGERMREREMRRGDEKKKKKKIKAKNVVVVFLSVSLFSSLFSVVLFLLCLLERGPLKALVFLLAPSMNRVTVSGPAVITQLERGQREER
jgi:hypothetical protein